MRFKSLACLALIGILIVAGCSSKEPGRYYSKTGFSIVFPEDWQIRPNFMGATVGALSPDEIEELGPECVFVIRTQRFRNMGDMDLDDFLKQLLPQAKNNGFVEDLREEITIDGFDAYKLIGTASTQGFEGASIIHYVLKDNTLVQIICAFPEDLTDKYETIITETVASFQFE